MGVQLEVSHWPASPVPYDGDVTIGSALSMAAIRWPDRRALIDGRVQQSMRSWTFAELLSSAEQVARALLTRFEPGARLAIWSTNRPEWILLQFGAALAGVTLVTVNPAYGQTETAFVLRQSQAHGLFVEAEVRGRDLLTIALRLEAELPSLHTVVSLSEWDEFVAAGSGRATALPDVRPDHPAQIQYTSGTTGFPKGALLAHRGLALNGRVYAEAIGAGPEDVWINPMPLFHTAGCGLVTLGALQTGGVQVLPRGFDAEVLLDLFERCRGTLQLSVPTMLIRMLEVQRVRPRDLESWRLATLGGAPVPVELVRRAERELGVKVAIGFGQTESSPYISHTRPDDPNPAWMETIGQPLPLVEVKIADSATGEPTPVGTLGEICTRGPCVMLEYFDNPTATANAIDRDGWLHTGDIGSMDAKGYLRVQGRLKDMIIRGGENIYPREIEDVLFAHRAVANVAVVGLPDAEWGEIVAAFVQLRPAGHGTEPTELDAYCRSRLAGFKVPRRWVFVSELPQTSSGKVQKFALRERYLAAQSSSNQEGSSLEKEKTS